MMQTKEICHVGRCSRGCQEVCQRAVDMLNAPKTDARQAAERIEATLKLPLSPGPWQLWDEVGNEIFPSNGGSRLFILPLDKGADAQFIAAANPNSLALLLAERRELLEMNTELREDNQTFQTEIRELLARQVTQNLIAAGGGKCQHCIVTGNPKPTKES